MINKNPLSLRAPKRTISPTNGIEQTVLIARELYRRVLRDIKYRQFNYCDCVEGVRPDASRGQQKSYLMFCHKKSGNLKIIYRMLLE